MAHVIRQPSPDMQSPVFTSAEFSRAASPTSDDHNQGSEEQKVAVDERHNTEHRDCRNPNGKAVVSPATRRSSARALVDREGQWQQLMACYHRIKKNDRPQQSLVLITGASGTGKSALARELEHFILLDESQTANGGGRFVGGKFDQLTGATASYLPFRAALTDYCRQLIRQKERGPNNNGNNKKELEEVRRKISSVVNPGEWNLLIEMVPALSFILYPNDNVTKDQTLFETTNESEQKIFSTPLTKTDNPAGSRRASLRSSFSSSSGRVSFAVASGDIEARSRLVFGRLFSAICSPSRPLVLFLDDLQWAQSADLHLLEAIVNDPDVQGLLLLGGCRGNEVSLQSDLAVMLRRLEDSGAAKITDIQVGNLDAAGVCSLVATELEMPFEVCVPLSNYLYNETRGNPFAAKQLLQGLIESGNVKPTAAELRSWTGNGTFPNDFLNDLGSDPVDLVRSRLVLLPEETQNLLKCAACFGNQFELRVLRLVVDESEEAIEDLLSEVERLGFIEPLSSANDSSRSTFGRYKFVHDKIQQAAYNLIPAFDQAKFHLQVGRRLWKSLEADELCELSVLVAHQLVYDLTLITEETECAEVSRLFLQATRNLQKASDFSGAAKYAEAALELLPEYHWRGNTDFSVDLFCSAAEIYFVQGRHEETQRLAREALENTPSLEDKARCTTILICSLGAQRQFKEAISAAVSILRELDEPLPRRISRLAVVWELRKTQRALSGLSDSDILGLPNMHNPKKLDAVCIMNMTFLNAFSVQPLFSAIIALKLVQMALRDGISAMTGCGFGMYSMVSLRMIGDIDYAYRFGNLALQMNDQFESEEWKCRTDSCVWGNVSVTKKNMHDCLAPLKNAEEYGLKSGDIEFAMMSLFFADKTSLFAGAPLSVLYKQARTNVERMASYRQNNVRNFDIITVQTCANLLGMSKDPFVMTGEHMNEDDMMQQSQKKKNNSQPAQIYVNKLIIAAVMGDHDVAQECIERLKVLGLNSVNFISITLFVFLEGYMLLTSINVSTATANVWKKKKKGARRAMLFRARESLQRLRGWAAQSPCNYEHRCCLLEAELAIAYSDGAKLVDEALSLYEQAETLAAKERYLWEQGMACERLGIMLLRHTDRISQGIATLRRARNTFAKWGAEVKVRQMDENYFSRPTNDAEKSGYR